MRLRKPAFPDMRNWFRQINVSGSEMGSLLLLILRAHVVDIGEHPVALEMSVARVL